MKLFSDVMYPSKGKRNFTFKTLKHSHLDRSPSGHPALADSFLLQESTVPGFSLTCLCPAQVIRDVVGCGYLEGIGACPSSREVDFSTLATLAFLKGFFL